MLSGVLPISVGEYALILAELTACVASNFASASEFESAKSEDWGAAEDGKYSLAGKHTFTPGELIPTHPLTGRSSIRRTTLTTRKGAATH